MEKKCDEENLKKYITNINCFGNHQFNNEIKFKRHEILEKFNLKDKKVILFLPWGPCNLYDFPSKITKFFAQNFLVGQIRMINFLILKNLYIILYPSFT